MKFDNITQQHGLSQSTVNCLFQDTEGFVWAGTQAGLNLLDGHRIKTFHHETNNDASLSDDFILCISENNEEKLLLGTMGGGLNIFDKRTEKVESLMVGDKIPLIKDNTVWSVLVDKNQIIWAGTSKGLDKIDLKNKNSKHFVVDKIEIDGHVLILSLCQDTVRNVLWIGTSNGLYYLNLSSEVLKPTCFIAQQKETALSVWDIELYNDGKLLLATDKGLCLFNSVTDEAKFIFSPEQGNKTVWSICTDDENIWFGTNYGLHQLEKRAGELNIYEHIENDYCILSTDIVWCIIQDRAKIIWAGTGNGISKHDPFAEKFQKINIQNSNIAFKNITAIIEDLQGNLWIGTEGQGLIFLDNTSSITKVYNEKNSCLSSDYVLSLLEDSKGGIWIGTDNGGLCYFSRAQNSFKTYQNNPADKSSISNNRVFALEEDKNKNIWIGTRGGGLCCLNTKSEKFTIYKYDSTDNNSISGDFIISLKIDEKGCIWAGTYGNGLSCYDPVRKKFTRFNKAVQNKYHLPDNNIWSILIDSKKRLWLATSAGLCFIENPDSLGLQIHLESKEGLPGNLLLGLVQDIENNIWISSINSISKLNMNIFESYLSDQTTIPDDLFRNYDVTDGLQSNEFGQGAYFISKNGNIYFGGLNGINRFRCEQIIDNEYLPEVRLTGFKIFNKEIEIEPIESQTFDCSKVNARNGKYYLNEKITYLNCIKLSSKLSFISFDFASLHFSRPEKNLYAYKLENFDENWNFIENKHDATYTNLSPGNYTFKVKSTNSDGIWNPNPMCLELIILPMFYQTLLFKILVIVILLISIIYFIYRYIHAQKKKERREKEYIQLQLNTIKNQIDPHFTFNVINTIAGMVYKGDPDRTYDYFSKFARLIRAALQNSEKLTITLAEETEFVKNYLELEKARFSGDLDYSIHLSPDVNIEMNVPKMLIQIFTENAIKHGLRHKIDNRKLQIRIFPIADDLIIEIEDNGIGRKEASQFSSSSTGKGLDIINRLLQLYKQLHAKEINYNIIDIYDVNNMPSGTKVEIIMKNFSS